MFYNVYKGKNWEYWLIKEVFEKAIGIAQVPKLTWGVHIFKGKTTSTRRVSTIITRFIKEYSQEAEPHNKQIKEYIKNAKISKS
jgi:hypothetical protein